MELNPLHPITRKVHSDWRKIAALIMIKQGLTEVKFDREDVLKLAKGNVNIIFDARGESETGTVTVRIVDNETAAKLLKEEGGAPSDN